MSRLWQRNGIYYYSGATRFSLKTKNKKVAETIRDKLDRQNELERFGIFENKIITIGELKNEWLKFIVNDKSESWWRSNLYKLDLFCNQYHNRPASSITTKEMNDYISELKTKFAPNTVLNHLKPIRLMFKYAVSNNYMERNPLELAIIPSAVILNKREPIRADIVLQILKLAEGKDKVFWSLCYYTGLDTGDAGTIQKADVIENVIYTIRKKTKIKVPIPLHKNLKNMNIYNVYPNKSERDYSSKRFKKLCAEMGVKATLKHLRHSFVSHLFDRGYSLEDIKILTGHTQSQMTGHYAQAKIDTIRRIINTL